jgi:Holliday junction resolvase RusA-like endonuclease
MIVAFTVPGMPRAKGRPRLGAHGVYTPASTREYEDLVRACAIDKKRLLGIPDHQVLSGPLALRYWMVLDDEPMAMIEVSELQARPVARHPDLDNALKAVLDGLQHPKVPILIRDDSQIVRIDAEILVPGVRTWASDTTT